MAKGDKYIGLKRYLESSTQEQITLSFKEMERIIKGNLPNSAYVHAEAWWANNNSSPQAIAWMDAGYETDFVADTFSDEKIVFVKI